MFAIETMNHKAFDSKILESAATEIRKAANEAGQKSMKVVYLLGKYAAETDENAKFVKALADSGMNFVQWAEQAFGFAKSTTYQFIKMSAVITCKKVKNKTVYSNNIHERIANDETGRFAFAPVISEQDCEFSHAQLQKMIPPKGKNWDDIAELVALGEIRPTMSCREIIEALKAAFSTKKNDQTEETDIEKESTDIETITDNVTEEKETIRFKLGETVYEIPAEILAKYAVVENQE